MALHERIGPQRDMKSRNGAQNSIAIYKQRVASFVKGGNKRQPKGSLWGRGLRLPPMCLVSVAMAGTTHSKNAHMLRYLIFALTLRRFDCICDL